MDSPGFIRDVSDKQRCVWGPHISGHKVPLSTKEMLSGKRNVCENVGNACVLITVFFLAGCNKYNETQQRPLSNLK